MNAGKILARCPRRIRRGAAAYSTNRNGRMRMRMTDCKAALSGERSGAMYAAPAVSVPSGETSLLWRIISSVCSRSAAFSAGQSTSSISSVSRYALRISQLNEPMRLSRSSIRMDFVCMESSPLHSQTHTPVSRMAFF